MLCRSQFSGKNTFNLSSVDSVQRVITVEVSYNAYKRVVTVLYAFSSSENL